MKDARCQAAHASQALSPKPHYTLNLHKKVIFHSKFSLGRMPPISTPCTRAEGHRFCASTLQKNAEGWRAGDYGLRHPATTQRFVVFGFRQRKNTQRACFRRSGHHKNTQRVVVFAFRQRENTQRVVVRAITTPRAHDAGPRFCISTMQKCDRSFLRFDNTKTRRELSFVRSRHDKNTQSVIVFAFRQRKNMQRASFRRSGHPWNT